MIKLLYVDDEQINLQLFKINFGNKYNVIITDRPSEGLEILQNDPDIKVVISDMKMPEMNGIEFITKAKQIHPEKLFFILTGFEINEQIQNAVQSKLILKYFKKPFNMNDISETIDSVL